MCEDICGVVVNSVDVLFDVVVKGLCWGDIIFLVNYCDFVIVVDIEGVICEVKFVCCVVLFLCV